MSTKTSSTSEAKPPAWATPLFTQSATEAQNAYNSGAGGNVYQGQTVAGLSGTTQAGINGVQSAAGAYGNTPNALTNVLTGPTSAGANLSDMASGKYLQSGNPYFNQALQGQLDDTANQVQSQFSGAGRYGSGANTNALTSQLGNIRSSALSNQFNQDSQNMLAANSQIDASRNNQQGTNTNTASALNSWNQGAIGANQATIQAGQLQDQNYQSQLDANLTKFQAQDMEPWTRLGLLQSAAAGAAGNYGTNVQTTKSGFNPMQAIGAVGSAATKGAASDIRLKEHIVPAGRKNGFDLYEWNYKGSPERYRGVMAQYVLLTSPDAVSVRDDGYLGVHYDRIGLEMEAL